MNVMLRYVIVMLTRVIVCCVRNTAGVNHRRVAAQRSAKPSLYL